MTALQYFDKNIKPIPVKWDIKPILSKESQGVISLIITVISLDIADMLETMHEQKLINWKGIKEFSKLANMDFKAMEKVSLKQRRKVFSIDDYIMFTAIFEGIADKSLSQYQKDTFPRLKQWLTTIYQIKFIQDNLPILVKSMGSKMNNSVLNLLKNKRKEIEDVFLRHYKQVSNTTFNFNQFDKSVFNKFQTITFDEFIKLSESYGG